MTSRTRKSSYTLPAALWRAVGARPTPPPHPGRSTALSFMVVSSGRRSRPRRLGRSRLERCQVRQLFYCCETATPGRLRVGRYYQRGLWESILSDEILMGGTLWGSIMAQDGWNPLKSHAKAMQNLERNNNLKTIPMNIL